MCCVVVTCYQHQATVQSLKLDQHDQNCIIIVYNQIKLSR